ncbi:MAG: GlsB/YeaQ/YmgE family stress response membrane protein [Thermoanaerobaculia bacterium]
MAANVLRLLGRKRGLNMNSLIWFLIIGAIAGWLAGLVMKGRGFGLLGDIIVGIVGAFLGGWLFGKLGVGFGGGLAGSLIVAFLGAVILLFLVRLIKRA